MKDIYIVGEEINDIILKRLNKGVAIGEVKPLFSNLEAMLIMWMTLVGIVEKASVKAEYITQRTGKSRAEFMEAAFRLQLSLVLNQE